MRPKFSAEVSSIIVSAKQRGATNLDAARSAGITQQSLYNWLAIGRQGREPYATFVGLFEDAERTELEGQSARLRELVAEQG
jgi:hypothetical protein